MTFNASTSFRNKKGCTAIGAALMAAGALATALAAGGSASDEAPMIMFGAAGIALAMTALVAAVFWIDKLAERLPAAAGLIGKTIWGLLTAALLLFTVSVSVLGWTRLLGFDSLGGTALGSLPLGIGFLTFAAGAVVLAWCRAPVVKDPKDGRHPLETKMLLAGLAAAFLVVMPGLVTGLPMKPMPAATLQDTVPAAAKSL